MTKRLSIRFSGTIQAGSIILHNVAAMLKSEPMQSRDLSPAPPPVTRRNPLKAVLAWLLELNRPVPQRTEDELIAEIERNYNWNFAVNLLDGVWFMFGASFISATTILPLFLSKLTTNPLVFGILAVTAQAGWFLPQLFTANLMERLARKKPVVVNLGLFLERIPIWIMVLAAMVAVKTPKLAIALLLGAYAWHTLGAGTVAVSWQDLLARCFPLNRRGRFFGFTSFLGAGAGALGALFSTWLLNRYAFPVNFTYVFTIAAVGISVSWGFIALTREPAQVTTTQRRSSLEYLAGLPDLLRRDENYRRYLVARLLLALGGMGSGFVTVAAVSRWQVPDKDAGLFTLALLAGQTAGTLVFGFLADRYGHKICLELGTLAGLGGFTLAWLAPAPNWYYAVFALLGILSGAILVSGILIVMEFSGPERRPTYMGIANTGVGVVGVVAPLLGTILARTGYGLLFAASATCYLATLILFHWWVREPRQPIPHAMPQ
jgi:MFS family permease